MEIERKYFVKELPADLENFANTWMEQGYLNVNPVVRVRRDGDQYVLTYKSGGMMAREEYNLPLNEGGYRHLIAKADGRIITKRRFRIPLEDGLTAELDVFSGDLEGLVIVEVEFPTEEASYAFTPPAWFGKEVTFDGRYHNSSMIYGALPPFSPEEDPSGR